MYYEKIGAVIRKSTPLESKPYFTEEQIEKFKNVSQIILGIIGVAGVIVLSAVAPNIFVAADKLFNNRSRGRKYTKKVKDLKLSQAFYYMKRSGQIKIKSTGKDFLVSLTKLGRKRLRKLQFETLQIPQNQKWDGKWWQVAADIPTKYKLGADLLRQKIKDMNFFPLQRTLWFYPFDPRDEVEFIANHYNIGRFVTVMEISRLDRDDERRMKAFFRKEKIIS